ncbi:hypothetical protein D3C76_1029660 [compost metagenome]
MPSSRPATVTPTLMESCMIIDSKLLPLLASSSGRSFSVRVFIDEKRVELMTPWKNSTSGRT